MDTFEADLAAFVDWWCSNGRKVRRRSTVDEYVRLLRQWMRWQQAQPGEPTSTPTLRQARAYVAEVRERIASGPPTGRRKALKAWGRFLVDDGLADSDPLADAAQPRPARHDATRRSPRWTTSQRSSTPAMTRRWRAPETPRSSACCAATGMRRGELIALEWSDIDFDHDVITLRNETTKGGEPGSWPSIEQPVSPCGSTAVVSVSVS